MPDFYPEGNRPLRDDTIPKSLRKINGALEDLVASGGGSSPSSGTGILNRISTLTGVQGGGASNLDGVATANDAANPNTIILFLDGGFLTIWYLRAGTDATDVPAGILRPLDYNGATNTVVWEQIL